MNGDRGGGAVSVPAAVALLAVLLLLGLAVDGVRAAQTIATADAIAAEAARAGAQAVDTTALARGSAAVDPAAAASAARAYLRTARVEGTVGIDGVNTIRVQVTVTRPTVLLGLAGRPTVAGRGSASARLVPIDPGAP